MQPADLIVENARVLTVDPARPRAEAIAVQGGKLVAVGDRAEIAGWRGPGTRVIDAGGSTVCPGFVEGHMHLFSGATELSHLQLAGVTGFEALENAVRAYVAARPGDGIVLAQGVEYGVLGGRPVTRHDLDRILPDRPFAMAAPDHHTVWANTAALRRGGVLHGKKLGPGNEIVMGADGLADGELREGEAFGPVIALAGEERARLGLATGGDPEPAPSAAERAADRETMKRGLAWCARHGITSFQNMDGNRYQLELLSEIEAEGGLICRARVPFHMRSFSPLERLDHASEAAHRLTGDRLQSGTVKIFLDGVIESWTAVLVDDYADRPGWRGEPLFSPAHFAELVTEIDRRGLQVAVHAVGEGAVRIALDGFEAARRANGARDSRHRIEHIETVTVADISRFAELGVIASFQPPHVPGCAGVPLEPTLTRIGEARWPLAYASRTLADAGARIVFASDWPVAPIDPLAGIEAAMTRPAWASGLPDQRFSLHEALAGYTAGGAYAGFAEHRRGVLKPDFDADLVVLSHDLEATDPHGFGEVRPLVTICAGEITFEA